MAENSEMKKWEGKVRAELKGIKAEQVWPFLEDFCNVQTWMPDLDKCYKVDGEDGKPGLIRHCATIPLPFFSTDDGKNFCWINEKLVMIDPVQLCLSYEVLENNVRAKSYVGTYKLVPSEDGCWFEWSVYADPIEGMSLQDYESFRTSCIQQMVKNLQALVSVSV